MDCSALNAEAEEECAVVAVVEQAAGASVSLPLAVKIGCRERLVSVEHMAKGRFQGSDRNNSPKHSSRDGCGDDSQLSNVHGGHTLDRT
jgi:hypothetical protein